MNHFRNKRISVLLNAAPSVPLIISASRTITPFSIGCLL